MLACAYSGSQSGGGIGVHVEHTSVASSSPEPRKTTDMTGGQPDLDCRGIDENHIADRADIGWVTLMMKACKRCMAENRPPSSSISDGQRGRARDQADQFA